MNDGEDGTVAFTPSEPGLVSEVPASGVVTPAAVAFTTSNTALIPRRMFPLTSAGPGQRLLVRCSMLDAR